MNDEHRLSTPKLFAKWAGANFASWRQAIGASVTHMSRGDGHVTAVSREAGVVSIHVHYAQAEREHPLWEFRTEFMQMTLPNGLTRDDLIPTVKAQRLLHEHDPIAMREAFFGG